MKKQTHKITAYLLAGFFTVFNVGLPIVLFVCPMMSNGTGVCECAEIHHDGLAISYPGGSCCNHSILAERNTTPFLSASKYQVPASEIVLMLSEATAPTSTYQIPPQILSYSDSGPPVSSTPLYILSATLLI